MKKIVLLITAGVLLLSNARAVLYTNEAFDFGSDGNNLGGNNGWTGTSGNLKIKTNSLSYPGLADLSPAGNKVAALASGGASAKPFTNGVNGAVSSGSLYLSWLMEAGTIPGTAATAVGGLEDESSVNNNGLSTPLAVVVKQITASTFQFGIRKGQGGGGSDTFTNSTGVGAPVVSLGSTSLIVAKYDFSTTPDTVTLWVNPSVLGGAEDPNPSIAATNTGNNTDAANIAYIYLRAGTGGIITNDAFRVGSTWADVTPTGNVAPPPTNSSPRITNAMLTPDSLELSGTNGMPNAFYHVLASQNVAAPRNAWLSIATNSFDLAGNFDCTVSLFPAGNAGFYSLLVPGGGTAPYITGQPQDRTVVKGQNAVFTVGADGSAPLSYQWYFNGGTMLAGETGSTLTVTNCQTDDAGDYWVVINNGVGIVTSAAATLTVIVPPSITSQPQNQTLSTGQDATFSVIASGSVPLHYQWYFNTNSPVANATNDTLAITNVQAGNAGKYSVIVTNAGGAVTSALAQLTINAGPSAPIITTEPQDQTVIIGQNATFTVLASGSVPLRYQWYFNTNTILAGATNSSLTVTNAQTNNAGAYLVIVTNNLGADTSVVARLTVNPPATNSGLIGYAAYNGNTTGGTGGSTVTVSNATDFASQVSSTGSKIVRVVGTITLSGNVKPKNNKTIVGVGTNATIIGDLNIINATNVIVQNLTFSNPTGVGDGDGVTIEYSEHVWVDHCTFYDCKDGELDTTHGSDWVTHSWNKLYYVNQTSHRFACLVGHSDGNSSEDAGRLHVTFHHNWWSTQVTERMPRTRFGRIHVFNNYFNAPGNNYCVRASIQSEVLVENNYFENIDTPYEYYAPNGKIRAVGNKTVNCSNVDPFTDTVFTPPYAYVLQTPDEAKASVVAGAGAGTSLFP